MIVCYLAHMKFDEWLKEQLRARDWTYQALGRLVGVAHTTIGQWAKGNNKPDPSQLRELARVTDTNPIWLFRLVGYLPEEEPVDDAAVRPKVAAILRELETLPDEVIDLLVDQIRYVLRPRAKALKEGGREAAKAGKDQPDSGDTD